MATNKPRSPRQKMINLMYLVFIAMIALNVPKEVLDGFDLVEDGLEQTIQSTDSRNRQMVERLASVYKNNPEKAGEFFAKASNFVEQSDQLYNYIQNLKVQIVKETDGPEGDLNNLKGKDKLGPASRIMLEGSDNEGQKLRQAIDSYKLLAMGLVSSDSKRGDLEKRLNTEVPGIGVLDNKSWEETFFEQMPTSPAITLLTKIQSDVRAAQGEVLADLYDNIDAGDYRVNLLEAQVIPQSEFVMEGTPYQGRVILSAVDTTQRPTFSIPGIKEDGIFSIGAGSPGLDKVFAGNLIIKNADGSDRAIPFSSKYNVVPRMSTIQVMDANVLYAGEENKLTISVPGASNEQLRASATNGSINKSGENWVAVPTTVGTNMKISVFNNRTNSLVSEQEFRVRLLPLPTPYFEYPDANGNPIRFRSGGRVAKTAILSVPKIGAAIDDGLVDRQFEVLRFSVVIYDAMGNRISEVSMNNQFTERQKALIRQLGRGKSFYISDVVARRNSVERNDLASLEVKLN